MQHQMQPVGQQQQQHPQYGQQNNYAGQPQANLLNQVRFSSKGTTGIWFTYVQSNKLAFITEVKPFQSMDLSIDSIHLLSFVSLVPTISD